MNLKLIAATFLVTATIARATLIDLTPGGFDPALGLPPPFFLLSQQVFFDEALPSGWVSQFGHINGGTYFFTDLIGNPGPNANVWWDFTGQPEGYWLTMIDVFGRSANGTPWENIYGTTFGTRFMDLQHQLVTLDGTIPIFGISFYGSNTVPDTGNTLALFSGAVILLVFFTRRRKASLPAWLALAR